MFRLNLKLFFQNKILKAATIASSVLCLGYFAFLVVNLVLRIEPAQYIIYSCPLNDVIEFSWVFTFFFLFVGCEYFLLSKKTFMLETLDSTLKRSLGAYRYQFLVMELMIGIVSVVSLVFIYVNTAVTGLLDVPYALHILVSVFLNIFLLSNVGLFCGISVAMLSGQKRLRAYLLMLLFALFCGPLSETMFRLLNELTTLNFYKIFYLFSIGPPNTEWYLNYSLISSVLPYQFCRALFWIFVSCAVFVLFHGAYRRRGIKVRAVASCLLVPAVICCVGAVMPQSKMVLNVDPDEFIAGDLTYYDEHYGFEGYEPNPIVPPNVQLQPFRISSYDMSFSAVLQLSAEVSMTVDRDDLDVYGFTLYHGYRVRRVCDQDGNTLPFVQDKDFITVESSGAPVQKITMEYKGYSPSCYSNLQGLSLPGDFAYYPRSGFQIIFDWDKNQKVLPTFADDDTQFNVRFSYGKTVVSNLESNGKNEFHGKSNGVTLVSGFYQEKEFDRFSIVMDYLNGRTVYEPWQKEHVAALESISEKMEESELAPFKIDPKGKKIFLMFNHGLAGRITALQDHIICYNSLLGLSAEIPELMIMELQEREAQGYAEN